ncbi:MAG: serine hydrolase [Phycisphaerae bacterium]|nr:serine hydrolase [Tepidisphaeraceae bacterium]
MRGTALVIGVIGFIGAISAGAVEPPVYPGKEWVAVEPAGAGLDVARLGEARAYALTGEGSGLIVRGGRVVMAWGDPKQRYDLKSTTKSFGAIALGLAVADGKVKLDDLAVRHQPSLGVPPDENAKTGWIGNITVLHLATQTAGFEKPGGYGRLLFEPGTKWKYSDGGPNWLAECLTLAYGRDLNDVMFERVFAPIGITKDNLVWRANQYREKQIAGVARREFGAGIGANVDAMARVGLMMLREGRWGERQILPADFVRRCGRPEARFADVPVDADEMKVHGKAPPHYGLLWWNNADGTLANVPRDAYWSWGLYDSLIVVIPSLDLVVARAGKGWARKAGAGHYEVLGPFLGPIVAAAGAAETKRADGGKSPYPPSAVIGGVEWAAPDTIRRQAKGSDNWPMTWADDGHQYTAYGDGWGFERAKGEPKLSLGIARVEGSAEDARGVDISAPTIEGAGDDARGQKASGILCVDGVLYLLARNAGNSQLAWSADHGKTWARAAWKFGTSFGCPTLLNAGKNYAAARDGYAYVYSPDADDAYRPADRMVLARVPVKRIREASAYEFFAGPGGDGKPTWSADVTRRAAVFEHAGRCFRSTVTYAPGLGRYLWVQRIPPRGEARPTVGAGNGLAIFDAPEPWGPWTTAYYADVWDVDPGDTACLSPKWLSADGKTGALVFAGEDSFGVRGVKFEVVGVGGR